MDPTKTLDRFQDVDGETVTVVYTDGTSEEISRDEYSRILEELG